MLGHLVAVFGALYVTEHTHWRGLDDSRREAAQRKRKRRVLAVRVVHQDRFGPGIGHIHDFQTSVAPLHHAPLVFRSKKDGLAVLKVDQHGCPSILCGDGVKGAIVEDVAVLVDLDEGCTLVRMGGSKGRLHVRPIHVVRPSHEGGFRSDCQADRIEGLVKRTERCRFRDLSLL